MADVTMPRLSDTMEEGKLLRWLKASGDRVDVGEILAEVETDKADMELESSVAGTIRELKLAEGESAPVGAVIAIVDAGGEGTKAAGEAARAKEPPGAPAAAGEGRADGREVAGEDAEAGGEDTEPPVARPAAPRAAEPRVEAARPPAAPAASRAPAPPPGSRARSANPADAQPAPRAAPRGGPAEPAPGGAGKPRSGAPGVVRVRPPAPAARPSAPASGEGAAPRVRRVPLSRMRASIARRMAESKREAPHFYLTSTARMDEAVRLRAGLREAAGDERAVTYNHMVLKACADALALFPEMNARFAGDAIEVAEDVNLGVAIAVEDGLLVPVIHTASALTLFEIAARARLLVERAQSGSFSGPDLSGATFSVSNLGMFGVESFSAVINPPQAGILAVGSVEQRPVVRDGALAVGHTMAMTLSCDHRVVDGAQGARFLAEVRRRLENPLALLLSAGDLRVAPE